MSSYSIHLYGVIAVWDKSADWLRAELDKAKDASRIDLYINSPGGSVFEGVAMMAMLNRCGKEVHTHIEGLCGSMATVLAITGKTISMVRSSLFMVHNPSGLVWGQAKDMRKVADNLDKIRDDMADSYVRRTKLTRDEIIQMMDDDTYLNATEAKDKGFIDEIIEVVPGQDDDNSTNQPEDKAAMTAQQQQQQAEAEKNLTTLQASNNQLQSELSTKDRELQAERERSEALAAENARMKAEQQEQSDKEKVDGYITARLMTPAERESSLEAIKAIRSTGNESALSAYFKSIEARTPHAQLTEETYVPPAADTPSRGGNSNEAQVHNIATAESKEMDAAITALQRKHGISYEAATEMYLSTMQ